MSKAVKRCKWAEGVSLDYIEYHDKEWGVPVFDDRVQFEFLILEGAQAGLSWSTILNKREGYRKAFADFDRFFQRQSLFYARSFVSHMREPRIVQKLHALKNELQQFSIWFWV